VDLGLAAGIAAQTVARGRQPRASFGIDPWQLGWALAAVETCWGLDCFLPGYGLHTVGTAVVALFFGYTWWFEPWWAKHAPSTNKHLTIP
jgi:hypothetical protein